LRTVDPVRHEEKRRAILAAAERCFLRDGFRGASISDICTEAGISPGHLYHYFESKEAIITRMTEFDLERVADRFATLSEAPNVVSALLSEFDQRLRLQPGTCKPALILEVSAEASRNPAIAALLDVWHQRIQALLADLIRQGQANGAVDRAVDPAAAAVAVFGVLVSALEPDLTRPAPERERINAMRKLMIDRFLAPPRSGRP
jgi:TetR/AcrR family transcriptional repressor of uid operon